MNFIIRIIFVACFCTLQVKCRSLQVDNDIRTGLDITDDVNHDLENGGRLSWKKLKPILRREVQRIRNVIGLEATMLDQIPDEAAFLIPSKEGEDFSTENLGTDQNEQHTLKAESQVTPIGSKDHESDTKKQREEPVSDSDPPGEITSDITHVENHELDLTTYEFPDNVMSDILNQTGNSIVFQALSDNSSKSFDFDETTLLSEGGQVAMLQEVSTINSELLIDSETSQNLILAELISTQVNLIEDDEDNNTTNDFEGGQVVTLLQEVSTIGSDLSIESETPQNLILTEIISSQLNVIDDDTSTDSMQENYSSTVTSTLKNENYLRETTTEGTSNKPNVADDEKKQNLGVDLIGSFQDHVIDISNFAPNVSRCPNPGWCIFWFLDLEDTCAKDSHCHGSLICCKWGCTMACVDAAS